MKTNLAKSAGFCFGVKRAIDIAYKTLAKNKNVYMLGNIVHNEDVAGKLKNAGIKKCEKLSYGKNKIFLIRAHGAGLNIVGKAGKLGYKIVDATCPMVKEIHKIVHNAENKGYAIIVIGDKKHAEVLGIIGQLKSRAIVIEDANNIPWDKLKKIKKACIVVQSTQNLEKVVKITAALTPRIKELRFFNTICQPTRIKQQEAKRMPLENDVMIIVGSKTSANTKRLWEISKSLNNRSYWVQSKRNIKPAWFKGAKTTGITAGASTPDDTTKEVIAYIKKIA
ncbi:MAG: 4-hydroxy-3-methylbut-2-enyl diphosphate reductase [Candidatus Omnitrophota bacterium]